MGLTPPMRANYTSMLSAGGPITRDEIAASRRKTLQDLKKGLLVLGLLGLFMVVARGDGDNAPQDTPRKRLDPLPHCRPGALEGTEYGRLSLQR